MSAAIIACRLAMWKFGMSPASLFARALSEKASMFEAEKRRNRTAAVATKPTRGAKSCTSDAVVNKTAMQGRTTKYAALGTKASPKKAVM